jgi:leucyl-tRNA synthetase
MSADTATEVERYDPLTIEPSIATRWYEQRTYTLDPEHPGERYYALTMFPYPSGDLHMGHGEIFTIHDTLVRHLRMTGKAVLNPFGWDAFGLPAENAAKQRGEDPRTWTYENIEEQRRSIVRLGYSFDWSTRLHTCDPEYYKWTQWLFTELFRAGLAYRRDGLVNWCPGCQTVLANEQVIDGRCERSGDLIERRPLTQWYARITHYADELIDDLDTIDWPERVKVMQRNWIGRSHGAEITFHTADGDDQVVVYTTRPDTIFGATYFVFAPEHPIVQQRMQGDAAYDEFLTEVSRRSEIERLSSMAADGTRAKRGVRLNFDMVNPFTGRTIPAYAADYVLMDYGTGAIMAVPDRGPSRLRLRPAGGPADRRDHPADRRGRQPPRRTGPGHDGRGLRRSRCHGELRRVRRDAVGAGQGRHHRRRRGKGWGAARTNYRLRDWLVSRQRSWGPPMPMVHCPDCGEVPVPVEDLPITLPDDLDWTVDGSPAGDAPDVEGRRRLPGVRERRMRFATRTRWTRSSIRRGTSCATCRPTTISRRGPRTPWTNGCPSTSTRAGSNTRPCT